MPAYAVNRLLKRAVASLALAASALGAQAAEPSSFSVQVTGQGRPMVLIPGLASAGAVWDGTVAHYAKSYQCHVLQLAGFAGAPPTDGMSLQKVEQELSDYIASHKLDHPVVVGHSLGGFLALRLAADHPEQLGKLVVVDALPALGAVSMPDITPEQLKAGADRLRDGMLQSDATAREASRRRAAESMVSQPQDVERVIGWGQKSDYPTVANTMHELLATDLRLDIARVQAPTLVLGTWVAYKAYAPRAAIEANFQRQYAKLPGVSIQLADNARHFIMYDDPQWLFERMDAFLTK
jgi:pimeloyl-ACP methyl ester carboxylesterase